VAGYNGKVPYFSWVDENIPSSQVKLRVSETSEATRAIVKGLGIGGLQHDVAAQYSDLVPVLPNELSWPTDLWLVTHHLVHRTAKVQAFSQLLKTYFKQRKLS
jgi:DNA-binding transcriptional LysR family regulator